MADATTELAGTCTGPGPCDVHPLGHGDNWVNKAGGLPTYIRAIAHALQRHGHSESRAVQVAIGTVKNWAGGKGNVSAATRARAAKAVAEWEALKARSHASAGDVVVASGVSLSDEAVAAFANMGTDTGPTHAGLAMKAADTGRVLMLQRALPPAPAEPVVVAADPAAVDPDPDGDGDVDTGEGGDTDADADPAAGKWEFPGGGHEDGDLTSLHTAIREWQEETGQQFPENSLVAGTWAAPNGVYQGHIVIVPNESVIQPAEGRIHLNPDDPDGDNSEAVAWWDPDDAAANPALREECKTTPWDLIKSAGVEAPEEQALVASAYEVTASGELPEHAPDGPRFVTIEDAMFAADRVYHFKHGWISLDHAAAPEALEAKKQRDEKRRTRVAAQRAKPINPTMDMPSAINDMMGRMKRPVTASGQVSILPWVERTITASGHDTDDLRALIAAALTEVPKVELPEGVGGGQPFTIPILLPTGIESGDRREFKDGAVEHRDLPVPLYFQKQTDDGHKASVIVGRIDKVTTTKHGLGKAEGVFDTSPEAEDALRLVRGLFLRGVSADVDKIDAEMSQADDGKPKVTFSKGRLTAATLVGKPAFAECMIELPGDNEWEQNMARLREDNGEEPQKSLVAAGGPMYPPKEWFDNPNLAEPTHLTVTDEGRVFGHIASWAVDHIGMPFQRAPRSQSGYRYFATGKVKTEDGDQVDVGQLTLVGGHADLGMTADMAVKHYDDTNSAVADVAIGEDEFGIWVAGAARPELTDMQLRQFRASDSSGDWRPIGNRLELVAICQVNCAGFPIPTARVASGGMVTALVAAGAPALLEATGRIPSNAETLVRRVESLEAARRSEVAMELRATVAAARAIEAAKIRTMVAAARSEG